MATFQNIRDDVTNDLQDSGFAIASSAERDRRINLAHGIICRDAQVYPKTDTSKTTVAGTGGYALPTDYMELRTGPTCPVMVGDILLVKPAAGSDDVAYQDLSTQTNGTPAYYWIDRVTSKIEIRAKPDSNNAGKTIKIPYWARPADMVNPTDVPVIPAEYHDLITHAVVAYYKNRVMEDGTPYGAYYASRVAALRALLRNEEYRGMDLRWRPQGANLGGYRRPGRRRRK